MMNSKEKSAKLSVVVASIYSQSVLKKCLDSILANEYENVEIIVAHNCTDKPLADLIAEYANVCLIEFAEKATLPVLWAAGIERSSGEIVAVTDSSCVVAEDWISAIFAAHQSDSPVVGGAVEMSDGKSLVDWAAYFCEYGQFMKPLTAGAAQVLPGNNISFKRDVLDENKQFVENEFWKTYLCQHLQADGIELISAPSMLVYYTKSFELAPFLIRRFYHGRCFAGMRIERETIFKRALFAVGTIFLPAVFLVRIIAPVLQKRRFGREFLLSFPISVLAILFWSIGETCGYLAGTGKSCEHIY
ncbi:MAG: glycosyltransferase [Acidobacteriota bacterium]|nr:glycosyltransferase [Acidobacteriota bacterium]